MSVDFAEIERLQVAGEWERAGELLADDARALQAAGVDLLVLCTNTMHEVADALTAAVDVPLPHIGDVTGRAVAAAGLRRVGLLATGFTMDQEFLSDRLRAHGLDVLVPEPDDRAEVHRISYEELCLGLVRDESRKTCQAVVDRLVARGAEGVILGCTAIELLLEKGPLCPPPLAGSRRDPAEGPITIVG